MKPKRLGKTMTPNWKNRAMWTGDNLDIMRGMNSESVNLIYLDPSCNSNCNRGRVGENQYQIMYYERRLMDIDPELRN